MLYVPTRIASEDRHPDKPNADEITTDNTTQKPFTATLLHFIILEHHFHVFRAPIASISIATFLLRESHILKPNLTKLRPMVLAKPITA